MFLPTGPFIFVAARRNPYTNEVGWAVTYTASDTAVFVPDPEAHAHAHTFVARQGGINYASPSFVRSA